MKLGLSLFSVALLLLITTRGQFTPASVTAGQDATSATPDKFVYADFEKSENGRAVSNGGGLIHIYTGQESTPVKFKGLANASPGAPEIVRLKDGDLNHLATFDYNLLGPNQWANVTLEIQGHPNQNGQQAADDVSPYKNLSIQMYATGVDWVRVEILSKGQGMKLDFGFPQMAIKLKPGLNTYLIPLNKLTQPSWVDKKVDTKEVLRKLTGLSISTYCNDCAPQSGRVVIDNVVFQK